MSNNKVCIMTTVHPPFDVRIFHREAKTLAQAAFDVTLIASHKQEERVEGIRIVPLPAVGNRIQRFLFNDWLIIRKAIQINAQVYHFHDPELIFAGLLLKLWGKQVVYDVHENVSMQIKTKAWIPLLPRKLISAFVKFMEKLALSCFDRIIIAGGDIGAQPHFSRFNSKIKLVRNFPTISIPTEQVLQKPDEKISFIYAGGLTADRGILKIITAFNLIKHNNAELILLGHFDSEDFKQQVLNEVKDTNIQIIPPLDYQKFIPFLAQSHVGLICFAPTPNNIGALSGRNNKIYEYLQAGLAVIGSDFPQWRDFIEGNQIGLVTNPEDTVEIAKAMNFIIENPDRLRQIQVNAKKLAEQYTWEVESRKLVNMYQELCQNKREASS